MAENDAMQWTLSSLVNNVDGELYAIEQFNDYKMVETDL
jgi:hypothetical protein